MTQQGPAPPPRLASMLLAVLAACLVTPLAQTQEGGRAEYVGGTVAALTRGSQGAILTTVEECFLYRAAKAEIRVPYEKINLLEYGQKASRRFAEAILLSPMLLLSKSRRHFLTVGYVDEEGRQQALVFRLHKDDVRAVLVSLEAKTGRKVQYQDEEARKTGKG